MHAVRDSRFGASAESRFIEWCLRFVNARCWCLFKCAQGCPDTHNSHLTTIIASKIVEISDWINEWNCVAKTSLSAEIWGLTSIRRHAQCSSFYKHNILCLFLFLLFVLLIVSSIQWVVFCKWEEKNCKISYYTIPNVDIRCKPFTIILSRHPHCADRLLYRTVPVVYTINTYCNTHVRILQILVYSVAQLVPFEQDHYGQSAWLSVEGKNMEPFRLKSYTNNWKKYAKRMKWILWMSFC